MKTEIQIQEAQKSNRKKMACSFLGAAAVTLGALGLSTTSALAAEIDMDTFGAESGGALCSSGVVATQNGNNLKVTLPGANVRLSGADGSLSKRVKCTVRVPAYIPKGHYLYKLTSRAESYIQKPTGVRAVVQLDTGISTFTNLSQSSNLNAGSKKTGLLTTYKAFAGTSTLANEWKRELCSPSRSADTIIGLDLGVFLQRTNSSQVATLSFTGTNRGLDLWWELVPCP